MPSAKLYVGDCVAVTGSLPAMSVDHACFSPPYDMLKAKDYDAGQRFDMAVWIDLCNALYTVLKPGAVACFVVNDAIIGGDRSCSSLEMVLAAKQAGFLCHELIPWIRPSTPYTTKGRLAQCWELCVVLSKGKVGYALLPTKQNSRAGAILKRPDGSTYRVKAEGVDRNVITDISTGHNHTQKGKTYPHAAPYPPELPARFIKSWCRPGGTILDCFTGISSTGVGLAQVEAGEGNPEGAKSGRSYIGIDLSARYIEWSRERLEATGYYKEVEVCIASTESKPK